MEEAQDLGACRANIAIQLHLGDVAFGHDEADTAGATIGERNACQEIAVAPVARQDVLSCRFNL